MVLCYKNVSKYKIKLSETPAYMNIPALTWSCYSLGQPRSTRRLLSSLRILSLSPVAKPCNHSYYVIININVITCLDAICHKDWSLVINNIRLER